MNNIARCVTQGGNLIFYVFRSPERTIGDSAEAELKRNITFLVSKQVTFYTADSGVVGIFVRQELHKHL